MSTKKTIDRFVAVAVGHNLHPAEDGKAPQVSVKLRCVEGKRAGEEVTSWMSLHENAATYTFEALRNMGWTSNDIVTCEGLGSTKVAVVEQEETYVDAKGKTRTAKRYQIWSMEGKATIADNERESFAKQFKALAASVKPIKVTDKNKAPDELPAPVSRNGATTAAAAPQDGPELAGVGQF